MSRDYSIRITLELLFTQENIHFIFQNAANIGCVYLIEDIDKKLFNINSQYLTVDQATLKILIIAKENDPYKFSSMNVRYQDTIFSFSMKNFAVSYGVSSLKNEVSLEELNLQRLNTTENQLIRIGAYSFGPRWDKIFKHGLNALTIDFARYIRVLLNICSNITLLELETYSDFIDDEIEFVDKGCVTVVVYINEEGFAELINNGFENKFIFFDGITNQSIEPSVYEGYETFKAEFPVYLYAKKNDITFKFKIKRDAEQGFNFISIYPLEPCLMKKGYGSEEEKIDIAFYIERLLEFCESFAIYEIKTFF